MNTKESIFEKNPTFADLHIHSRFSRACSKDITIENLAKWGKIKGLDVLGTGDFTHEKWLGEIREKLEEREGILGLKTGDEKIKFIFSGEISLMYTQDGKGRRIHFVLLAPSLEIVKQINSFLDTKGRRDYDGRPIFGFSAIELVEEMKNISNEIEIIPAHAMTPWFGIFGSETGFDSLKEAFGEREKDIHAVESGMSADPGMLRKFGFLNKKAVVSFSDSHSFWPFRLGREATIFSEVKSYKDIIRQTRENSILGTIETSPAYGKYHYDGHRNCNFSSSPEETKELGGICPVCKKQLTIGVENRVEKIANQKSYEDKPYFEILPLHEIIALAKASTLASKKTWGIYNSLIEKFGNELNILLKTSREELLRNKTEENLVELILQNREGKIRVKPGFDGEYGVAMLEDKKAAINKEERKINPVQKKLF